MGIRRSWVSLLSRRRDQVSLSRVSRFVTLLVRSYVYLSVTGSSYTKYFFMAQGKTSLSSS